MAVDLSDAIDSLKREVNPPGSDVFPDATDDDYLGYLQDAFWEARLDGVTALASFNNADGVISPVVVGGVDLTGDFLQLIVYFAGVRILRNQILNMTDLRAVAGPVTFESKTQAATVLAAVLATMRERLNLLLLRLSDIGAVPSYVIDAVAGRQMSIGYGDVNWVGY